MASGSHGRVRAELGNSWVIESETDDWSDHSVLSAAADDNSSSPLDSPNAQQSSKSSPRAAAEIDTASQFIMPDMSQQLLSQSTPRKRQPAHRHPSSTGQASRPAATPPRQTWSRRPAAGKRSGSSSNGASVGSLFWTQLLRPVVEYTMSTFGYAMSILRPFLGAMMAVWIISYILSALMGPYLSFSLLSPVCSAPFATSLLPVCATIKAARSGQPEFDALMAVQGNFDKVLESSVSTASLPMDMKRSEASLRDLRHVVDYSTLPSKNELVFELTGFVDTARQASGDLARFNSRIGRAVDAVISTNRWTLQVLDGIDERSAHQGSISRVLAGLVPFFGHTAFTEDLVLQQYLRHTGVVEEQIANLIVEAQTLLAVLVNLDDRLDVISSVAARDGLAAQVVRDQLFADLWTWIGGNRGSWKRTADQLRLLRDVSLYQKTAFEHVSVTILTLQDVAASLEDLRDRISAPEIENSNSKSKSDRTPLRVHIENIEMGLDRLERQRGESRKVEGEDRRKILDRAGATVIEGAEKREIGA